jgi:hypothetical protein
MVQKKNLRNCVFDLCQGLSKRQEKKIRKEIKKEKKRKIHINRKVWNHKKRVRTPRVIRTPRTPRVVVRPPRVIRTPRPFVRPPRPVVRPPRPVVRPPRPTPIRRVVNPPRPTPPPVRRFVPVVVRRGRGDVWMQTKGGKWIDVNDDGTFLYLKDSVIGLNIFTQFRNIRGGSFIKSVALVSKGKTIVCGSNGRCEVDGELIKRRGALFDFKDDFKISKFKRGFYEFVGLHEERLAIEYEKESRSWMIVVGSNAEHHEGLYVNPENPEKYQITKEENPFKRYIEFKKITPTRASRKVLRRARRCCKKLLKEKRKECVSDYIRTRKCLHYLAGPKPHLNSF